MELIDSHCHLDDARFDADRAEVIGHARASGIVGFVVPAVRRHGWERLAAMAAEHPSLSPAYGMHPWFCDDHGDADVNVLADYLQQAVAVGECGLDFGKGRAPESVQLKWFRAQLELADVHRLPVIVHAYKAVDRVCSELKSFPAVQGVIHSFSGSQQQAEKLLERGFYLGIGGSITYPQAEKLSAIVQTMPLEQLLLETDAPDQPPCSHRGQRNEPAFLIEIARQVATLRGMDVAELGNICNCNARELFGI